MYLLPEKKENTHIADSFDQITQKDENEKF